MNICMCTYSTCTCTYSTCACTSRERRDRASGASQSTAACANGKQSHVQAALYKLPCTSSTHVQLYRAFLACSELVTNVYALSGVVVAHELTVTVSSFALRWCVEQVKLWYVNEAGGQGPRWYCRRLCTTPFGRGGAVMVVPSLTTQPSSCWMLLRSCTRRSFGSRCYRLYARPEYAA